MHAVTAASLMASSCTVRPMDWSSVPARLRSPRTTASSTSGATARHGIEDNLAGRGITLDAPAGKLGQAPGGEGAQAVRGVEGALVGAVEGGAGDDARQFHRALPTVPTVPTPPTRPTPAKL